MQNIKNTLKYYLYNEFFNPSEIAVVSKKVEDDGNGGTRTTEQESQGDTVVMSSNGSSSDPFITKVYNPAVTGVIITAEGATSSKVKYEIQLAVSKLYDIGLDKVNVYPSKN